MRFGSLRGHLFIFLVIFLSLSAFSSNAYAHHAENPSEMVVDNSTVCPPTSCPDALDILHQRGFFEVIKQMPNFTMRAAYICE